MKKSQLLIFMSLISITSNGSAQNTWQNEHLPRTYPSLEELTRKNSVSSKSSTNSISSVLSDFNISTISQKNKEELNDNEKKMLKNFSTQEIINLYGTLKNHSIQIARIFLIKKKYASAKTKIDEQKRKKIQAYYKEKFDKELKQLQKLFNEHQEKLLFIPTISKLKKITLDEELYSLLYGCAEKFITNQNDIKTRLSRTVYSNRENVAITIEERKRYLKNKIEQISNQELNKELAEYKDYKIESNKQNQINVTEEATFECFNFLVQQFCITQEKLSLAFSKKNSSKIEKYKKLVEERYQAIVNFIENNKSTLAKISRFTCTPKISKNHILFSPMKLHKQFDFINHSRILLPFILDNKTSHCFIIKRKEILENEKKYNMYIKKLLQSILKMENLT